MDDKANLILPSWREQEDWQITTNYKKTYMVDNRDMAEAKRNFV